MAITVDIQYFIDKENLCETSFNVYIDGETYIFPRFSLESGGLCFLDKNFNTVTEKGPWRITKWPEDFPKYYKEEVIKRINTELERGCCGACCAV